MSVDTAAPPPSITRLSSVGEEAPVQLLERVRAVTTPVWTRMPVWKTVGYTLDISSRFLLANLFGKGTIARADELIDGYWRRIMQAGNARLFASGREHFTPGAPHIVMSNHGSLLDIPALMGAIPGSMRMVLKEELTRIPVWGQALVASGFVPVDRKKRSKAIAQLEKAKRMLAQGVNIWISPEGTRARDQKLAPFKRGGFHLATDLGIPIIPAFIDGAQEILPPDQFKVRTEGDVHVRFGAPIPTEGADIQALSAKVRQSILDLSGRAADIDATLDEPVLPGDTAPAPTPQAVA